MAAKCFLCLCSAILFSFILMGLSVSSSSPSTFISGAFSLSNTRVFLKHLTLPISMFFNLFFSVRVSLQMVSLNLTRLLAGTFFKLEKVLIFTKFSGLNILCVAVRSDGSIFLTSVYARSFN